MLAAIQQQLTQLGPMQQQLAHLPEMHEQLQTVTNKVAYLEARDDSDYDDCDVDETELSDVVLQNNAFFIGDEGAQQQETKGRGRRSGAGNAASILRKSRA